MNPLAGGTLDTNLILRYLQGDVPEQYRLVARLLDSGTPLYISLLSIAEAVYVFQGKGFARDAIRYNIERLLSYQNVDTDHQVVLPALELYANFPALSFVDACLAYEAEANQALPLWTFDKKLAKQAPNTELLV